MVAIAISGGMDLTQAKRYGNMPFSSFIDPPRLDIRSSLVVVGRWFHSFFLVPICVSNFILLLKFTHCMPARHPRSHAATCATSRIDSIGMVSMLTVWWYLMISDDVSGDRYSNGWWHQVLNSIKFQYCLFVVHILTSLQLLVLDPKLISTTYLCGRGTHQTLSKAREWICTHHIPGGDLRWLSAPAHATALLGPARD